MAKLIQPSFAGGEVSPSVAARVDLSKRAVAVERAENFFVRVTGGMESRPGLQFIAEAKTTGTTRIIPFEFNTEQTYILEVGDQYMRFYTYGGQILSGVSPYEIATPYVAADLFALDFAQSGDVMTIVHPNYAPRELVRITNTNWTLTEISFAPSQAAPTALALTNNYTQSGGISGITQANPAVVTSTSHGLATGAEIEITGVVGMTEVNGNTYRITAIDADTFRLEGTDSTGFTAYTSGGTWTVNGDLLKYKVTANNRDTFEESLSALSSSTLTITGITQADPAVITLSAPHTLEYGDEIYIDSVVGMTQLNDRRFLVLDAPSSTTIEIMSTSRAPIDSTGYGAYVSGGSVRTAFVTAVATAQAWDNTITWAAAADADTYNVYRADESGLYGFIGRTDSLTFTDDFIEADTGDTAPLAANPFEEGAGFWPSTTGFFQQRQIYANSDAFPNRFWMTQTGVFYNFATSTPLRDDDAIIATLAARRINEIRHIIPLSDLVILTTGAEFRVKGQGDAAFTPSTINIKPQSYYGSTALRPIVAGDVALYMAPGNFIRELSYEFATDKFTGRDITVLARHLLDYNDIVDWAFAPSPYELIWLVRDDGTALVLTYQNEQEVYAWTRATTLGDFKSVAVVREGDKDIAYFVVRRTINGTVKQFVERLDEREFSDLQDAFCVDAGLSLDVPITITNMTAADPVVVTAPAHGLSNGDIVDLSDVLEVSSNNTRREVASADYTGTGFIVANATTNTFELNLNGSGYDGSGFAAYSSGGVARKAVTALSGLSHLEGAEVVAAANGYAETGLVVSGGSITLSTPASRVHVGLPYTCQMITLPISTYGGSNTVDKRTMNINRLTVQVERTMGMWTGPSTDLMREAKFGLPSAYGQPLPMVTEDVNVTLKGDWSKEKQVVIEQRSPLPLTILAVAPDVAVGGN
jgi:hypothetical protein